MRRPAGFTLLELILVCAIVATLAALVGARLSGSNERARLFATARGIVALARGARVRASSDGRAYVLVVDLQQREARLARWRDPLVAAKEEASDPELESDSFLEPNPWSREVPLEDGVELTAATVAGSGVSLELPVRIAFSPDGTADEAALDLSDAGGYQIRIAVEGASGRARILTDEELDASVAEGAPPPGTPAPMAAAPAAGASR